MTTEEFSNGFDTLVSSYRRFKDFDDKEILDSIEFDEYEKSFFLTKAQDELVVSLYNGKNPFGDSFENTEELRRYLDTLVETKVYTTESKTNGIGVSPKSVFFTLPNQLAFITMEQVTYSDDSLGCFDGSTVTVVPVTQDEYGRIKNNPFRGATKNRVLRLDCGDNNVELVSKYNIKEYFIRYIRKPKPIILESLPNNLTINGSSNKTECELDNTLHNTILSRAVVAALQAKQVGAQV